MIYIYFFIFFLNIISSTMYYKLLSFWKHFNALPTFSQSYFTEYCSICKRTMTWLMSTHASSNPNHFNTIFVLKEKNIVFLKICVSGRFNSSACGSQSNRSGPWFERSVDLNARKYARGVQCMRLSGESLRLVVSTRFRCKRTRAVGKTEPRKKIILKYIKKSTDGMHYTVEQTQSRL